MELAQHFAICSYREMIRVPPPWTATKNAGGYVIRDANGTTICQIYVREPERLAEIAKVLDWDAGRRVAAWICRLPELVKAAKK